MNIIYAYTRNSYLTHQESRYRYQIKVGQTSRTPEQRVREQETSSCEELILLWSWIVPDWLTDKGKLHPHLESKGHKRIYHEWFSISGETKEEQILTIHNAIEALKYQKSLDINLPTCDTNKPKTAEPPQETNVNEKKHPSTKFIIADFYEQLKKYADKNAPEFKLYTTPSRKSKNWYVIEDFKKSHCHLYPAILPSKKVIECGIYINYSKQTFNEFYSNKEAIEKELKIDTEVKWLELPEKVASRIRCFRDFDINTQDKEEAFAWLVETCLKFKKVFSKPWKCE